MCQDSLEVMLQRVVNHQNPDLHRLRPGGVWDAYVRARNVCSLFDSLRQKMSIRRELCPIPYGELEFELRVAKGYVFGICGADEVILKFKELA